MKLGRKQHVSHEDFVDAFSKIETLVTREQLEQLLDRSAAEVRAQCAGKRVAYAWSAGKDSLALQAVMQRAGVTECVLVMTDLEYPAFLQWVTDHMPDGLQVVNTRQDLDWLEAHPDMLFPQDSATAGKWFHCVQHRGQALYYREHHLDVIALGRRRADGNFVGRGGANIYTADGITRYSPICDWTHEHVLAYLHYYRVALPPLYGWPRGFRVGTGPWPARQWCNGPDHGWEEVWTIDPDIVRGAARKLPQARAWMQQRGLS